MKPLGFNLYPSTPKRWELCFTALEPGACVSMKTYGNAPKVTLEYSLNGAKWLPFIVNSTIVRLPKNGSKVYMRAGAGGNTQLGTSIPTWNYFYLEGGFEASGNVMSLIDGEKPTTVIPKERCFMHIFEKNNTLITAPEFPATELKNYCYDGAFTECSYLTKPPELPATQLVQSCYAYMFYGCASLKVAPKLIAPTVATLCYDGMFNNCTSLIEAPDLIAPVAINRCYTSMFMDCKSLVVPPKILATRVETYCYDNMFKYCTSLVEAPEIHSTNGEYLSYKEMFRGCRNLRRVKTAQTSFNGCSSWLGEVSSVGEFICSTSLGTNSSIQRGSSYCPSGWTVINEG